MDKNRFGTVLIEYFIAVVSLLCFVRIDYFYEGLKLSSIYTAGSTVAFFVIVLLVLVTVFTKRTTPYEMIWAAVFVGYMIFISLLLHKDIYLYFTMYSAPIGLCLLAYYFIANDKLVILLNAFFVLEVFIYLNFLTTIVFPNGMYSTKLYTANWLLGYKNPQIRFIIPVLGVSVIRGLEKENGIGIGSIVLYICSVLSMLRVNSSTGILAIFLFGLLVFVFLFVVKKRPFWFNLRNICIVFLILNIGLFFFNIQTGFDVLFESMGKNTTLTGRTQIWSISLSEISKHFIIGQGFLSQKEYVDLYHLVAAVHPHNFLLYILMQGGIIYLAILTFGFMFSGARLKKYVNASGTCVIIVIVSLLFVGLNEALTGNNFLYMFILFGMKADKFVSAETPKKLLKNNRIKITL